MARRRIIVPRFTDDRGRPVGLAIGSSSEDVLDALHGQKWALLDQRFDVGTAIVTIAAMLVAAPMFVFNLGLLGLILGFIAALIGVRLAFHAFFESPVLLTRGYVYIHRVVRAGFCPSCDYRIDEIEASADGMLVCPECGAAWRTDRRVVRTAPGDADRRRAIRSRLRPVLRPGPLRPRLDHRSRPASLVIYRPMSRLASDYGAACDDAARAIFGQVAGRGLKLAALLVLAGFGLFVVMLLIGRSTAVTPRWVYLLIPVMAGLLFFGFLFRSGDVLIDGDTIERETLARGLCPGCWELLYGIEPDADGATPCPECGAAWRVPRPTRDPPLACPRCRYPLAGLPQEPPGVVTCPECGEVVVGVRRDEERASGSG
ncbi:MAG: hypothetical protein KJZ54_03270 [Phycisphaerales bacterium]|nr:hypothetical protein [Phycisphaerales bacterium]